VNLHLIVSSPEVSRTCDSCVQRSTNCRSPSIDLILLNPRIHQRVGSAAATVWFFRHASLKHSGAISCGARPLSHLSFQNFVLFPSPTVLSVHSLKRACSATVSWMFIVVYGLVGSFHFNQGHRRRKALLKHARSLMPSPPKCLAQQTRIQLTGQWPLRGSSLPVHKNFLRMRSILVIAHLERGKDVMWYTGIEVNTEFTSARRPARVRRRPFHPGKRAPILSISTCSSALRVLPI
jgi:hypothetical protein